MVVTGCGVGVYMGCGWVGEWVMEKWHSLYVNTHNKHEYSVRNSIWPKKGLCEFWKNTSTAFNFPMWIHLYLLPSSVKYDFDSLPLETSLLADINAYIQLRKLYQNLCINLILQSVYARAQKKIETLRFSRLNKHNVSLVAIGAVILVMQRQQTDTLPWPMMRHVYQSMTRGQLYRFFYVVLITESSTDIYCTWSIRW